MSNLVDTASKAGGCVPAGQSHQRDYFIEAVREGQERRKAEFMKTLIAQIEADGEQKQ